MSMLVHSVPLWNIKDCKKKMSIFFAFIIISTGLRCVNGVDTHTEETLLRTTLKTGYDQTVRPATPTEVTMFYSIRTLQSLDITQQDMTTTSWLSASWYDPRLVWNISDYNNISEFDANWVWRPEFFVSNSAKGIAYGGYDNDKVRFRVFNTGTVRWIIPLHLTTTCDVDISRFPFDSQFCYIEIIFWALNFIDVTANISTEINTFAYLDNAEWRYDSGYTSKQVMPVCCPVSNSEMIYFNFNFTRLRPFYVINLIVPAMILSICMVLTFLLPTECGERLGYSLTILLSYTVLMTITTEMMPTTSKQTPHIDMYLLITLVMCSGSVLNVVISVKMFYLTTSPPKWLQKVGRKLRSVVFCTCCCKSRDKVNPIHLDDTQDTTSHKPPYEKEKRTFDFDNDAKCEKDEPEEVTWQQLAELQDRMCFFVYTTTVLALIFMFVLALQGYV